MKSTFLEEKAGTDSSRSLIGYIGYESCIFKDNRLLTHGPWRVPGNMRKDRAGYWRGTGRRMGGMRALLLALALAAGLIGFHGRAGLAQAPTLTVADRTTSRTYSRPELLADPRLQTVGIAYDPVYGRPMTYRAIAIAAFLNGAKIGDDDHVQARAVDDFSVSIPAGLLTSTSPSGPEAFLAVEDPAMPWPAIPGTTKGSAGPFYIVWRGGTRAEISSEYWAYHLAALAVTDSAFKRWPGLAVDAGVPAADPIRRGLDRFVAVCMACHRRCCAGTIRGGRDLAVEAPHLDLDAASHFDNPVGRQTEEVAGAGSKPSQGNEELLLPTRQQRHTGGNIAVAPNEVRGPHRIEGNAPVQ